MNGVYGRGIGFSEINKSDSGARWVEGWGSRGRAGALPHHPSVFSMFARRREVIEYD